MDFHNESGMLCDLKKESKRRIKKEGIEEKDKENDRKKRKIG